MIGLLDTLGEENNTSLLDVNNNNYSNRIRRMVANQLLI